LSLSVGNNVTTFNAETDMTPNQLGPVPATGTVTRVSDGVVFFPNLKQVADPGIANISTAQGLQQRSAMFAIADSSGKIILVNPAPGEVGSTGYRTLRGPGTFGFDANLVKRVKIGEGAKEFEFRVDAINILNKPVFDNPTLNINSTDFGRITAATGNRIVVLNARINF
jgi:hypothetical protein